MVLYLCDLFTNFELVFVPCWPYPHTRPNESLMSFFDLLIGKPLATTEERAEHIGPIAGIPVFGLDALSSAAYGPEAALTLLIPLGTAGVVYILPITFSILALLTILYFSYRQTIAAYPGGGGSYTVARENIGESAGLLPATFDILPSAINLRC